MKKLFLTAVVFVTAMACTETDKSATNNKFMKTQDFLNGYAAGLLSYSPEEIASYYQVPLTVYSDQGIQQVSKMKEVEAFWKQGVKPYEKQAIKRSVPTIVQEEQLSEKIITCKVLWKNYDSSDKEVAQETNFYILSKTDEGLKISGLIIMAQK